MLVVAELGLAGVALVVVFTTTHALEDKAGLGAVPQAAAWALLVGAIVLALAARPADYRMRLLHVCTAMLAPVVLVSVHYETLFYAVFVWMLLSWVEWEHAMYERELARDPKSAPKVRTRVGCRLLLCFCAVVAVPVLRLRRSWHHGQRCVDNRRCPV